MILVLLGSHDFQFNRLLNKIEKLKKDGIIKEEVVVQSGCSYIETTNLVLRPFIHSAELDTLYDQANLIITHGGSASIIKGVKKGKKVVAVARLKKYNEVIDDHQKQIIKEFAEAGYIIDWKENETYDDVLNKLKTYIPKEYISRKHELLNYLEEYIKRN